MNDLKTTEPIKAKPMVCECGHQIIVSGFRKGKEKDQTIMSCSGCGKITHDFKDK